MTGLIRAELAKLWGQRAAMFWGFAFVPAFLIILAVVLDGSLQAQTGAAVPIAPVRAVLRALSAAGNPIVHLFFAIGAAALFALEYRHAGWRLLVPRRSRAALLGAKLAAFMLVAAISLTLLALGNLASLYVLPWVMGGHPVAVEPAGAGLVAIGLAMALSLLQLASVAACVALLAVLTRSTMGAILPPFLLALVSAGVQAYIGGSPGKMLALPGAAADWLRAGIANPFIGATVLTGGETVAACLVTTAWFVVPWGAALLLFARQDLARQDLASE